jgi:hypothetical protein
MATEKFGFIQGGKVENAIRYELYEGASEETPHLVAKQSFIQSFDIFGGMNTNGKPHESRMDHALDAASQAQPYMPIFRESEHGPKYYFRVKGKMRVTTDERVLTNVPFEGVIYVNSYEAVKFSFVRDMIVYTDNNVFEGEGDDGAGIFLDYFINPGTQNQSTGRVKVYQLDGKQEVVSAYVTDSISIYDSYDGYCRTSYIPIDALTDDLNGGCVGYFSRGEFELPVFKICFYDANFAFLHGATAAQVLDKLNKNHYLTVQQVKDLGVNTAAKYVIFSSQRPAGGNATDTDREDQVSVGKIYFPLFNYPNSLFRNSSVHPLTVKAIGDGFFFTDSPASNIVTYTRNIAVG